MLHKITNFYFEAFPGSTQSVFEYCNNPLNSMFAQSTSYVFLWMDLLQYLTIVYMLIVIGTHYTMDHSTLVLRLVNISKTSVLAALLINVFWIFNNNYLETILFADATVFSGLYQLDVSTQFMKIVVLFFTLALYSAFPITAHNSNNFRTLELPLLIQITIALSVVMLSSSNYALLLLALEGFSLTLYVMTALGRTYGGITASVKYFAFGTLGSIFLFWGMVHVYTIVPTLNSGVINFILDNVYLEPAEINNSLNFATTAMTFGFMLKIGAAPGHQWVADTYAGVHLYITAYFSIFVKTVIFLVFLRLSARFNYDALTIQFAIISILVGCAMSLNQTEVKRLLAYSSVVHVGFLLMADASASLLYLFTYIISSLLIFFVLLETSIAGEELIYLNDFRYLRHNNAFNTTVMVAALASSAGLPPFAGFYGKFFVWSTLLEDIYLTNSASSYVCLVVSTGVTLLTIFYYMRIIAYIFIGADKPNGESFAAAPFITNDFYRIFLSLKGVLLIVVIFWTLLQGFVLQFVQTIVIFL